MRPLQYKLDENGEPVPCESTEDWGKSMRAERHVAKDLVNGYLVSTIFLGLDHRYGEGPPLLYETMVFKDGSWNDLYSDRYSTRAEAVDGHKRGIEFAKAQGQSDSQADSPESDNQNTKGSQ